MKEVKSAIRRALDKRDRGILFQLDANSRKPYAAIAKELGISKAAVGYRVNRLVKRGIIKGFFFRRLMQASSVTPGISCTFSSRTLMKRLRKKFLRTC